MKKLMLLFAMLVCYGSVHAQLFQFGLRGGVSSSQIKIDDTDTWRVDEEESEFGFHAGVFARIQPPLIGLYVQPELLFSSTGGTVTVEDVSNDVENQVLDYNFNRIDIPVMVGWKFGVLRLNVGPTFNVITKAERKVGPDDVVSIKDEYKNATIGYQAGAGLDLGPLLLDLKYEGSLSKYGESISLGGQQFATDHRNNQLILSVGIKL